MPDIVHDFPINATSDRVYEAVSSPAGLDSWWTLKSSGEPAQGNEYVLWFGPEHDWRAVVTRCDAGPISNCS
ncbi:MAG: SRPBCC family protein [Pyrinomonadaceae bacterium]